MYKKKKVLTQFKLRKRPAAHVSLQETDRKLRFPAEYKKSLKKANERPFAFSLGNVLKHPLFSHKIPSCAQ